MPRNVHNRPSARQIQPMGFRGRPEAISAPTTGKAKTGTEVNMSMTVMLSPKVLGSRTERARTKNATLAKNMSIESAASDQASHAAERVLIPLTPRFRPCLFASSVTTAPYSTNVSQALRQPVRSEREVNFGEYTFQRLSGNSYARANLLTIS